MLSIGILFATSSVVAIAPSASQLPLSSATHLKSMNGSSLMSMVSTPHLHVKTHLQMLVHPGWKRHLSTATLIPSNLLEKKDDNLDKSSDSRSEHPTYSQKIGVKPSRNQFCRIRDQTNSFFNDQRQIAGVLTSAKLIKSDFADIRLISNQILRSLQALFRLSTTIQQDISPLTTPAVVVRREDIGYEVWLNNRLIATLPTRIQANILHTRLNRLLKLPQFSASQLIPRIVDGIPTLMAGNLVLFPMTEDSKPNTTRSTDLLAIEWVNNLRMAMQVPTLSLVQAQIQMYGLTPSSQKLSGLASWYGPYFHGRTTANGETFNENDLTVAHKSLPFNTFLKIRNLETNKSVIARVNDRGPYIPPRSLDLSRVAARCLNGENAGVVPYEAVIMNANRPSLTLNPAEFKDKFRQKRQKPRQIAVVSEF